ncbi:MAG: hypothetical protein R3C01_05260 [Planctomycetaceae bacterium]
MATDEQDREDLMKEATALTRRGEWLVPDELETVIAGFRRDDSLSLYFGPDPVYQFDPAGRLRRAFVDGHLFRSEGTTLAQLDRRRVDGRSELIRVDLSSVELTRFLETMTHRLDRFLNSLTQKTATLQQSHPANTTTGETIDWLPLLQQHLTTTTQEPHLSPRLVRRRGEQ